jgi:hypothetical protein
MGSRRAAPFPPNQVAIEGRCPVILEGPQGSCKPGRLQLSSGDVVLAGDHGFGSDMVDRAVRLHEQCVQLRPSVTTTQQFHDLRGG